MSGSKVQVLQPSPIINHAQIEVYSSPKGFEQNTAIWDRDQWGSWPTLLQFQVQFLKNVATWGEKSTDSVFTLHSKVQCVEFKIICKINIFLKKMLKSVCNQINKKLCILYVPLELSFYVYMAVDLPSTECTFFLLVDKNRQKGLKIYLHWYTIVAAGIQLITHPINRWQGVEGVLLAVCSKFLNLCYTKRRIILIH